LVRLFCPWPSRAARARASFLQRPPGKRSPPSPAASSRSRARRVPEAHRQDRPESWAGDLPPKRRRPSRQGRLWAVATAANSPHGLRLCGEHGANVGYTPRFW
jgi:hypothetical protein